MSKTVIGELSAWSGVWEGGGINHEKQHFNAMLVARPLFGRTGMVLWFRALGLDGERYHEEVALLGPGMTQTLQMLSVNTNLPFAQEFQSPHTVAVADGIAFHHGDHSNVASFRETISLTLVADDLLRFAFLWGMPGEPVAARSSVDLARSCSQVPDACPLR